MTRKELFEKHEQMCKNCTLKNECDGIHLTIANTTKCQLDEIKPGGKHETI